MGACNHCRWQVVVGSRNQCLRPTNGGGTQGASAAAAGHKSADEMLDELLEDHNKDEKEPAAVAVK